MLKEALIIALFILLIVLVIFLILICIKLLGLLNKTDYLVDNVTKKVESLDEVFSIIDMFNSKFSSIVESVTGFISKSIGKIFQKKEVNEKEENNE